MNGDGPRRRRRSIDQPATGGRLPLFPLFIVVVLAGLALGAFLSRHFSGPSPMPQVVVRTPAPSPLASAAVKRLLKKMPIIKPTPPLPTASPSAEPSTSASPRSPRAVIHRVALTTPKPQVEKKIAAAPAPSQAPVVHAAAVTHAPLRIRSMYSAPLPPGDPAAAVARDYLVAVIKGDNRTANSALGKSPNSLPNFAEQSFLDPQARITSLHTTNNGDGTYKVEAEVAATNGTYYVTFQVMKNVSTYFITEHYAIKVQ